MCPFVVGMSVCDADDLSAVCSFACKLSKGVGRERMG